MFAALATGARGAMLCLRSTGACLEVRIRAELKELACSLQRLLMVSSAEQRLHIPSLCFDPALHHGPHHTLSAIARHGLVAVHQRF